MDQAQLLDILKESFTLEDLKELCIRLDFDFENLASGDKRTKAIDLISEMKKQMRYDQLVAEAITVRPDAFSESEEPAQFSGSSPPHFKTKELHEIHRLLISAGFDNLDRQENLLAGMNEYYKAGLPVGGDPASQIWQRLDALNRTGKLSDGELPFETLLTNAIHFSKPRAESVQLEIYLKILHTPRVVEEDIRRQRVDVVPLSTGPIDPEKPNIAAVRALLLEAFAKPEELRRFCLDRPDFQPLVPSFGSGGVASMVDDTIDFCRTRLLWQAFLDEVKEYRPRLYARHEPKLYSPER